MDAAPAVSTADLRRGSDGVRVKARMDQRTRTQLALLWRAVEQQRKDAEQRG